MAKGNVAVRQFMRNKNRFADFYNLKVFGGKQVVLWYGTMGWKCRLIWNVSGVYITERNS